MGRIRRQSVLGAANLYAGQALGFLNKAVLFPIAFATQEEYWGLLTYMIGLSTLIGGLSTLGFSKVIQRFVPIYQDKQAAIIRYSLLWTGVGGVASIAGVLIFKDNLNGFSSDPDLMSRFFPLFICLLLAQILFEIGSAIFNANFKTHYSLFANNVSVRSATTLLLVAKFIFGFEVGTFIALVGVVYLLNHLVLFFLALRKIGGRQPMIELPKRSFSSYAVFMMLLTLVSQSFLYLDGLLVGHFLLLSQLAIFDLTKNLGSVLDLPSRALGSSALPTVSQLMSRNEIGKIQEIYVKGSFIQVFLGLFLFALVVVHLDLLLEFLYDGRFDVVKPLFLIIFIGKIADMSTGLNWAIISNSSKYWANLIIGAVVLVVVVGLEWVLIPQYGLYGAALGIALALVLNNLLRTAYLYQVYKLLPFSKLHLKLLPLITLLPILIFVSVDTLWLDAFLKDLVLFILAWYYSRKGRTIAEVDQLFIRLGVKK